MAERERVQKKAPAPRREEQAPKKPENLEEQAAPIEEKLDKLDEMIDEALGENEEEAERRSQEFVDHFIQEGGQ